MAAGGGCAERSGPRKPAMVKLSASGAKALSAGSLRGPSLRGRTLAACRVFPGDPPPERFTERELAARLWYPGLAQPVSDERAGAHGI